MRAGAEVEHGMFPGGHAGRRRGGGPARMAQDPGELPEKHGAVGRRRRGRGGAQIEQHRLGWLRWLDQLGNVPAEGGVFALEFPQSGEGFVNLGEQLFSFRAAKVERPGGNQVLQYPLVDGARVGAQQEILKTAERAAGVALRQNALGRLLADALDAREAETDRGSRRRGRAG